MRLDIPDPDYAASRRSQANFRLSIRLTLLFIGLVWTIFLVDWLLPLELALYGLRPRETVGLLGLVTTPLLHGSLAHIASNTMPLFIGGVAMLFLYPNSSLRALPAIYFGSAALAWVFARPGPHIGASGLVYGILAFVFVSGILRRDVRSVVVSLMVGFFYGSMIWGVFPAGPTMSWELHATGLAVGVLMALLCRHRDRPPMKRYDWEDEDPDEDVDPWWEEGQGWQQQQSDRKSAGWASPDREDDDRRDRSGWH